MNSTVIGRKLTKAANLPQLLKRLIGAGQQVLAPVRQGERVSFMPATDFSAVDLDYVQSVCSAKEAVFPRHEMMMKFTLTGKDVDMKPVELTAKPTVLFGVHPCDAASFTTLRALFTWDSPDEYFETKLDHLTVIGLSCAMGDSYCFCTSLGSGPGDTRGSDILLTRLGGGQILVEVLTEKGRALVASMAELFTAANGQKKDDHLAKIARRFDGEKVKAQLPERFNQVDLWREQSMRCIGCGACAYVCPTCSCFDIQDERQRNSGERLRCWDSCGFRLFTLHASGHNPRTMQSERWRQRVMHKFSYQPQRLDVWGCVGCGRCSRGCPVDMNLGEHLQQLAEL
ncbi:MAG: hypothetical protein HJJLKODD_02728 [Phycisphaerae bacterium]|nr:hypothetical protein [Phycisphaerae bacterium]